MTGWRNLHQSRAYRQRQKASKTSLRVRGGAQGRKDKRHAAGVLAGLRGEGWVYEWQGEGSYIRRRNTTSIQRAKSRARNTISPPSLNFHLF